MIALISSLEIIKVICFAKPEGRRRSEALSMQPDPNIFLRIAASVTDATAVNPNGIKTLLANGLSTIFAKGNPVFSNGPKRLANT